MSGRRVISSARAAKAKATLEAIEKEQGKARPTQPQGGRAAEAPARLAHRSGCTPHAFFRWFYPLCLQCAVRGDARSWLHHRRANDKPAKRSWALPARCLAETEQRTGGHVQRFLADTGYASIDDIAALGSRADHPVTVYVPPPPGKKGIKPENLAARERKRAKEPPVLQDWRTRMASEEGEAVMKRRKRIELVNAQTKNRGFGTMLVRGLAKSLPS